MYITLEDIQNHIDADIVAAICPNGVDSNTTVAINQAVSQIRSYLLATYQIDEELAKADDARDALIVMLCLDLVVYHLFTYVDASHIPAARAERYKAAVDFLKDAQNGVSILNIPATTDTAKYEIKAGSNPKRGNHY